jgi:mannose-1-phosphate guanylyltransferase
MTKALVLAAGKSTRIHPVSKGLPKPLIEVKGETILGRNLRWLAKEGVREVFINLHYRPDDVRAAVGDGSRFGVSVRWSEETEILGTSGAVKKLSSELTEPFFVIYGDNLLSTDLGAMMRAHVERGGLCTIGLFDRGRHPHTGIAGGRVRLEGDRVIAFLEGVPDEVSPLVNAGIYAVDPRLVDRIPSGFSDFGKDVFPKLLEEGAPIYGHMLSGYCLGIDTPESWANALQLIDRKEVELA